MPKVTGFAQVKSYMLAHKPLHLGHEVLRYDIIRSTWTPEEDPKKIARIVRAKVRDGSRTKWLFVGYLDDVIHNIEHDAYEGGSK